MLSSNILEVERQAMSFHFPQFEYKVILKEGRPVDCWEGFITPIPELDKSFKIQGVYKGMYPPSVPAVYCLRPYLTKDAVPDHPHLNHDGTLCIFFPSHNIWKPGQYTMADMLYFTTQWLCSHLYWEKHKIWPWASTPCGEGSIIHIKGTDQCFCGSGLMYRDCHESIVRREKLSISLGYKRLLFPHKLRT